MEGVMKFKPLLTALFVFVFSQGVFAVSYHTGNLTSAQEVPPNASTATGFGRVTLNNAENSITVSFYWSGLTGNATAGHIHGAGAVGVNAPVIFNLAPAATTSGSVVNMTFAPTPAQVADLKAGLWYFNLHTAANPGGEIRGQIAVDAPYLAYIDNKQENPATVSTARGGGAISVNAAGTQALVSMNWTGLSGNATVGHVHNGRSRTNGPVVCDLTPPATAAGSVVDRLCTFTAPQMTLLRQGQFYLNIHTAANPGGEIRGQIQRRRSTVLDFDGDSKTDYAVARNNAGAGVTEWWITNSSNGSFSTFPFGTSGEFSTGRILAGDYDGDGKDDPAIWRTAASPLAGFLIFESGTNTVRFEQFGTTGDDPRIPYDYDGDGRCDLAVFRTSDDIWYFKGSSNNAAGAITFVRWGASFPNPGDFDGDGRGDFMNQIGGEWWILRSSDLGVQIATIGTGGSFGVPGDYDGDGRTDVGVTTSEVGTTWYYASSLNPTQNPFVTRRVWGTVNRTRAQGDYDGDGKSDYAVWETGSQFFWVLPSNGTSIPPYKWGTTGDFAVAGYNNR